MRRLLTILASLAVLGGIIWAIFSDLESGPSTRTEPPAIVMRAPEGFDVEQLGGSSLAVAAADLRRNPSLRAGVDFSEEGDEVILLADRGDQRVIEMRSSSSGTIVERVWVGDVDRRLDWAVEHGTLEVPGLPPATGKNLYH